MAFPKPEVLNIPVGGMFAAGDAATVPTDYSRLMQNVVSRPGRWEKRAPYVDDSATTSPQGLANWDDQTNRVSRVVQFCRPASTLDLRIKSATSGVETYGGAVTGVNENGFVADYANYKGSLFYSVALGVAPNTLAAVGLHAYNGTSVTQYPLGGETLQSLTITAFKDRLFLGYVLATVVNQLGTTDAYDSSGWTAVNCTASNITNGSTVTSRITPTSTTASQVYRRDKYSVAASTSDTTLVFRGDDRSGSSVYDMPMTYEIYASQIWVTLTAYALGAIRVPTPATGNGFRYRVTVAGTAAAGEPVWPTTVGTTIVDGTVTWICDGPDAMGSTATTLPNLSSTPGWTPTWVTATIPANPAASSYGVRIKYFSTATPTITLAPVDFSYKDGLTDGLPDKSNKGKQLTTGKFFYPFFNQQSSATATITLENDLYWTDVSDPNTIRGSFFFRLRDGSGRVTAATTLGGRLIVFKRRGMWVFQGTNDPDNPLLLERFYANVGCVGPRALTVFEDVLYFVGENEVYSFQAGGQPQPLCGDAMRETIMAKGSGWIESYAAGTILQNVVSATVDELNRDLIISTQNATPFVFCLDRRAWSYFANTPGNAFNCQIWNSNTGNIYALSWVTTFSNNNAIRLPRNTVSTDQGSVAVVAVIDLRAIAALQPETNVTLDEIHLRHMESASQAASTFTLYISLDGGLTFPKSNVITLPTVSASDTTGLRTVIAAGRFSGSEIVIRLQHSGDAGSTVFRVEDVNAIVRLLGPARTLTNPTQGATNW